MSYTQLTLFVICILFVWHIVMMFIWNDYFIKNKAFCLLVPFGVLVKVYKYLHRKKKDYIEHEDISYHNAITEFRNKDSK